MEIDINYNVCMPWVWSVAHWLEQQPRYLKMWGSIPYHAHHFLIRFAFGVRTTLVLKLENFTRIRQKILHQEITFVS